MPLHHDPAGPVVLVGGSGVVGRYLAPLLHQQQERSLVITGRDARRAESTLAAVRSLGGDAAFVPHELGTPLSLGAAAVVGLVNDPEDALLSEAVEAGVPFVDITRWTGKVAVAMARMALMPPRSAVVLSSGWMGGLLARLARALMSEHPAAVVSIDGSVRYALADASGADSVDYMDRLWLPFEVPEQQRLRVVEPFRDRRYVHVDGRRTLVHRFDTPDQWTLPMTTAAPSAVVRLGFDSNLAGFVLGSLVRMGAFRWLRSERFRSLRRGLLRSPGSEQRDGARAAFRVDVAFADGMRRSRTLVDQGQARLTAVGAWLALRQALAAAPGLHMPEQDPSHPSLLSSDLPRAGVSVLDEAMA